MPEAFEKCRENGGRVRTISGPSDQFNIPTGQYRRICILNGKIHRRHLATPKKEK